MKDGRAAVEAGVSEISSRHQKGERPANTTRWQWKKRSSSSEKEVEDGDEDSGEVSEAGNSGLRRGSEEGEEAAVAEKEGE